MRARYRNTVSVPTNGPTANGASDAVSCRFPFGGEAPPAQGVVPAVPVKGWMANDALVGGAGLLTSKTSPGTTRHCGTDSRVTKVAVVPAAPGSWQTFRFEHCSSA